MESEGTNHIKSSRGATLNITVETGDTHMIGLGTYGSLGTIRDADGNILFCMIE